MASLEPILQAVFAKVATALAGVASADDVATRNAAFAERLESRSALWANLLDGAPAGGPVGVMGGGWEIDHVARLTLVARGESDGARDARFAAAVAAIVAAFPEDETLGGLADLVEVQPVEGPAPEVADLAAGFKAGELPILILYTAATAAG